jgi:spermidine synthase
LKNDAVRRLLVIDLFQAVIDWHQSGLVPNGAVLTTDSRCELLQGDFFELAKTGFDADAPRRRFDAVLLDIDHTPEHFLNEANRSFYARDGLSSIRNRLKPGGVFAVWSNDAGQQEFTERLRSVFGAATVHDIEFSNHYTGSNSVNAVYVAQLIAD